MWKSTIPVSTLVVPEHILTNSKIPFIELHNHQWIMPCAGIWMILVEEMDSLNMGVMVNLMAFVGKNSEWYWNM